MKRSKAKRRYRDQRIHAFHRGINFELTFEEWDNWWLSNGVDKNYSSGNNNQSGTALCMCRNNDEGPYSLNNIYCATRSENSRHKTMPGTRVEINGIEYKNCCLAGKALNVSSNTIKNRCITQQPGYKILP